MTISQLAINQLRSISQATIFPHAQFNVIAGDNGSGKTSILEAIYLLGLGRSFRSRSMQSVIQLGKNSLTIFGLITTDSNLQFPLGIERHRDGSCIIRAQEHNVSSIAELAHYLPLQLINQDSYQLLVGSPKQRRHFLDWGLFHVEQNFFPLWKRFQRSLQQRNAALRSKVSNNELKHWDHEFIEVALQLDKMRAQQLVDYLDHFKVILANISKLEDISLSYKRGWPADLSLEQALAESIIRDRQAGFTHFGPHRADIDIKQQKILASQVLSRGQQKILTYGLLLGQGAFFSQRTGRRCIYLLDDIPAELDKVHIQSVLKCLQQMQAQLFLTSIDKNELLKYLPLEVKVFQVEKGQITAS